MSARSTKERPVDIAFSGPSGGAVGAAYLARRMGVPNVLTFDMGGTSTDVALCRDGEVAIKREAAARLLPVPGARGRHPQRRRRRRLDRLPQPRGRAEGRPAQRRCRPRPRLLRPRRHGADGHRRQRRARAGSRAARSSAGAWRSTSTAAERRWRRSPRGSASTPSRPRRRSSTSPTRTCTPRCASCRVERGYDPRDFGLVAFGGAGPLHANALARLIGADPLIIPSTPGVLSAFGFLAARRAERVRAHLPAAGGGDARRGRRSPRSTS